MQTCKRSICDALPKSDVNDATQRDVFLKGLSSQLTERVLQKKKSKGCSFNKLVDIAHKYWISLTEAGVLRHSRHYFKPHRNRVVPSSTAVAKRSK
eukprot:COSAG05_NODE_47_length_24712_cov_26.673844_18_plen_96_part_00